MLKLHYRLAFETTKTELLEVPSTREELVTQLTAVQNNEQHWFAFKILAIEEDYFQVEFINTPNIMFKLRSYGNYMVAQHSDVEQGKWTEVKPPSVGECYVGNIKMDKFRMALDNYHYLILLDK
jgi:hypothetical protein